MHECPRARIARAIRSRIFEIFSRVSVTSNMYMLMLRMCYFTLAVIANGRSRQLKADFIGY